MSRGQHIISSAKKVHFQVANVGLSDQSPVQIEFEKLSHIPYGTIHLGRDQKIEQIVESSQNFELLSQDETSVSASSRKINIFKSSLPSFEAQQQDQLSSHVKKSVSSQKASNVLAALGLSSKDLDEVKGFPEDKLTLDTLPKILKQIKKKRASLKHGKSDNSPQQNQSTSTSRYGGIEEKLSIKGQGTVIKPLVNYGYDPSSGESSPGSEREELSGDGSRKKQRHFTESPNYRSKFDSDSETESDYEIVEEHHMPCEEESLLETKRKTPILQNIKDFLGYLPVVLPHCCSLCDKIIDTLQDWNGHINDPLHKLRCLLLQRVYPEWNPGELPDTKKSPEKIKAPIVVLKKKIKRNTEFPEQSKRENLKELRSRVVVLSNLPSSGFSDFDTVRLGSAFGRVLKYLKVGEKAFLKMDSEIATNNLIEHFRRNPLFYGRLLTVGISSAQIQPLLKKPSAKIEEMLKKVNQADISTKECFLGPILKHKPDDLKRSSPSERERKSSESSEKAESKSSDESDGTEGWRSFSRTRHRNREKMQHGSRDRIARRNSKLKQQQSHESREWRANQGRGMRRTSRERGERRGSRERGERRGSRERGEHRGSRERREHRGSRDRAEHRGGRERRGHRGSRDWREQRASIERGVRGGSNERRVRRSSRQRVERGVGSSERRDSSEKGGSSEREEWGSSNDREEREGSSERLEWGDSSERWEWDDSSERREWGDSSERQVWGDSSERREWGDSSERREWGDSSERREWGDSSERREWGDSSERLEWGDSSERREWGDSSERREWGDSSESREWGDSGERREWGDSGERREWGDSGERREWGDSGERREWGDSGERREWGDSGERWEWDDNSERQEWGDASDRLEWGNISEKVEWGDRNSRMEWGDSHERVERERAESKAKEWTKYENTGSAEWESYANRGGAEQKNYPRYNPEDRREPKINDVEMNAEELREESAIPFLGNNSELEALLDKSETNNDGGILKHEQDESKDELKETGTQVDTKINLQETVLEKKKKESCPEKHITSHVNLPHSGYSKVAIGKLGAKFGKVQNYPMMRPVNQDAKEEPGQVVYIADMVPGKCTKNDLIHLAELFGKINNTFLIKAKGEGFVEMSQSAEAQAMVKFYQTKPPVIQGNIIRVEMCQKYKKLNVKFPDWDPTAGGMPPFAASLYRLHGIQQNITAPEEDIFAPTCAPNLAELRAKHSEQLLRWTKVPLDGSMPFKSKLWDPETYEGKELECFRLLPYAFKVPMLETHERYLQSITGTPDMYDLNTPKIDDAFIQLLIGKKVVRSREDLDKKLGEPEKVLCKAQSKVAEIISPLLLAIQKYEMDELSGELDSFTTEQLKERLQSTVTSCHQSILCAGQTHRWLTGLRAENLLQLFKFKTPIKPQEHPNMTSSDLLGAEIAEQVQKRGEVLRRNTPMPAAKKRPLFNINKKKKVFQRQQRKQLPYYRNPNPPRGRGRLYRGHPRVHPILKNIFIP
ncbi:uncharacterized protein LOC125458298 isoform X2 [Stegostoma tigrinum]|uniref:uncharacterized protein LOC125458298 isoform X2 n=1 Tax=Stegostoma tigrinum TaxID=3053191 RepID=UPI002870579A|nr:uncharacterized protein LOC125458298 isoform X2 [Stegostoma tigrinum]